MSTTLGCWVLVVAVAASGAALAQNDDTTPRFAAQQVNVAPRVILAGVPDLEVLGQLPADDTVVVDLRTAPEGIAAEAALLRDRGFEYHHIPVAGAQIDPIQIDQLRAIAAASADNPDATLIVHCRSGNRAGMLWGAYLLEQGQSLDQVLLTVGPALTGKANRDALLKFSAERNAAPEE